MADGKYNTLSLALLLPKNAHARTHGRSHAHNSLS
jgi:hypothetical protein